MRHKLLLIGDLSFITAQVHHDPDDDKNDPFWSIFKSFLEELWADHRERKMFYIFLYFSLENTYSTHVVVPVVPSVTPLICMYMRPAMD